MDHKFSEFSEFSEFRESHKSLKHKLASILRSFLLPVSCWCCGSILVSYTRCGRFAYCFYRPQRSCGKVMFLHLSVILFTEGCLTQCMLGYTPSLPSACWGNPQADTPLGRHSLQADTPRADTPSRWLLLRTVCILLECILVKI